MELDGNVTMDFTDYLSPTEKKLHEFCKRDDFSIKEILCAVNAQTSKERSALNNLFRFSGAEAITIIDGKPQILNTEQAQKIPDQSGLVNLTSSSRVAGEASIAKDEKSGKKRTFTGHQVLVFSANVPCLHLWHFEFFIHAKRLLCIFP